MDIISAIKAVVEFLIHNKEKTVIDLKERQKAIIDLYSAIADCLEKIAECRELATNDLKHISELDQLLRHLHRLDSEALSKLLSGYNPIFDLNLKLVDAKPEHIKEVAGAFKGRSKTIVLPTGYSEDEFQSRRSVIRTSVAGMLGFLTGGIAGFGLTGSTEGTATNEANGRLSVKWTMLRFSNQYLADHTLIGAAPRMVCDRVRELTEGKFEISLLEDGELTDDILNKVNSGLVECGYSGIYYSESRWALFFGCAIPFGLNPQDQIAWLNYKKEPSKEETFMQSVYGMEGVGLKNILAFPAGTTGAQMGGWFPVELTDENYQDQLKKLTMRIPGLGGIILHEYFGARLTSEERHGAGPGDIPLEKVIERYGSDRLLAVEWTGPYDDNNLGLNDGGHYYYYPGWWEPGTTFDLQINRDKWEELPMEYKNALRLACQDTLAKLLHDYNRLNSIEYAKIPADKIRQFPENFLIDARKYTQVWLEKQQNRAFKEVYSEWLEFQKQLFWQAKI